MPANDVREYLHDERFGTGMLYRPEDPRNALMTSVEDIRANLIVGYPDRDETLTQHTQYSYNQGPYPSCVWHALSGQQTANERIERHGEQIIFDAMAMHLATGPANEGRYTGDMLRYAQDNGILVVGGQKRYKVGSYAFAPKDSPQNWEATIKAAIAAGHICGLALLLPSSFGWESSGSIVPNSYHEVLIVGYRPDAFLIKNSWGAGWGQNGFGWVPIAFLTQSNYQNGYVFANTILDAIDPDIQPLPPNPQPPEPPTPPEPPKPTPTMRTLVTAIATGGGLEFLKRDKPALTASGGGFSGNLEVTNVVEYEVPPGPNPPTPPNPPNPPEPPTPPTPGTLKLRGQKWRGFGLIVDVSDENSRPVIAVVSATANGAPLPTLGVNGNHGSVVTFNLHGVTGTVALSAQADDGRKGTGEVTV